MRSFAAGPACLGALLPGALLAGAFWASAPAAFAQPVAQPSHLTADVVGFNGDPEALPRAIDAIEQSTGGVVTEARFANASGVPGFDAAVAKGGQITLVRVVRPGGGVIALTGDTVPLWAMHWRARRDVHYAVRAPVGLSQAVRTAEKAAGGAPAVAAGIAASASAPESDVHAYNVLVAPAGGAVRRIAVDSATGQPIQNPSALANWP